MDFVKREDQNIIDEENYKVYMESLQKTHQMDTTDYQHTPISMEQIHQAMQSSLNTTLVHNFQLPLSPRQMSTLMLKTNHIARNLNFNDIQAHLPRNLTEEIVHNLNELPQNLRHDELRLDIRSLAHDLELQNGLVHMNEQDFRINDLSLPLNREMGHDLNQELDLSHHLNRPHLDQDLLDERRTPVVLPEVLDQNLVQRLEQNVAERIEQNLAQKLDQSLAQRLDPTLRLNQSASRLDPTLVQRLDHRLVGSNILDNQRHDNEHLLPMPFHIKSEQEEDAYFYDNINQGASNGVNSHTPVQVDQPNQTIQENMYIYNNIPVPALNPIDLYSRPQYVQYTQKNYREPQNLVVHRQYENSSSYHEEFKKSVKDKIEEPKENLKPNDNKMFYDYPTYGTEEKNDNKIDDVSMNIKGEYTCYKCNEIFPSKRGLKQHAKSCTEAENSSEKAGKFSCTQCAYRCQSPAILKIHERTHSGEKPFSCTFCDYKSGQKNNVVKHILVHMKEKPFRCQYCDYRCAQKNNLVVHERTHTGYKPFACPYCDYRTVQKPNLVKHMYLHTDQKPFSCDMCNYRCVQKTNLTKHKQRHLNEKEGEKSEAKNSVRPYRPRQKSVKCPHCSYRCVQKTSLDKHLQFKHSESVTLECEVPLMSDDVQNLSVKKEQYLCQDKTETVIQS